MKKILITLLFMTVSFLNFSANKCDNNCIRKIETVSTEKKSEKLEFSKITKETFNGEKFIVYTALWCPHCRAEYKHIQKIYEKYPDNFNIIVFISNDNSKEEILEYMNNNGYTFPIYYDSNSLYANIYQIEYYPTIIKHKRGEAPVKIKDFAFNLENYYQLNKYYIDKNVRNKFENIYVINKENKKQKLNDVITKNALVMYGAPWCPDCIKESKRLNSIKGKRDFIYLIDSKKFTLEEYKEFLKTTKYKNVYYVDSPLIRERFNIKWIPSVLEVKDGIITNSFIPNNIHLIK